METLRRYNELRIRYRDLSGDNSGSTAVEFAMISPILLLMLFGMLELGWLFIRMSILDSAVAEAGRSVYTGAAAYGYVTHDDIEEMICDNLTFASANYCKANIAVELTVIEDFNDAPDHAAVCEDDSMKVQPLTNYEPGAESEIVYMRVCLTTPLMLPAIGMATQLPQTEDGRFQMTSAITFMNEPFGSKNIAGN